MKRTRLFRLSAALLISLAVTGLAWAGLGGGIFQQFQLRLQDSLFPAISAQEEIVVVSLDDHTLDAVGSFPLPREYHARLIDRLSDAGARLVGYDVLFTEISGGDGGRELSDADAELVRSVDEAGNVILGAAATFPREKPIGELPTADSVVVPFEELNKAAMAIGHVNAFPDPGDGIVRATAPLIETPDRQLLPSLAYQLYLTDRGIDGPVTLRPEGIQIGADVVPTGEGHLMEINWAPTGGPGSFAMYSLIDVVNGDVPDAAFRDRIVLVGATALGLGDHRLTPLDKQTGQPGVFVHANTLNTMRTRASLFPVGRTETVPWIFALALVIALAVGFLRQWLAPLVALGAAVAYYLYSFWRFDRGDVLNLVYPALAVVIAYIAALAFRYFTEFRERRRVTHVFGRYVAEDVVEEVLAAPERALATLEGAERPISVLFADLRGFTAASEGSSPTEVVAGLNIYLDAMVRAVNEEGGTIDKFMGDCVMAFWGAPRYVPNHAERAIKAGLTMQDYIEEAKQRADEMGLRVPGVGVGISTGAAVVGNIGSHERLDYTVIGDTVNTASRICGVAEAGEIVVTEESAAAIGKLFPIAPLPPLKVKGKRELLKIFQVLRPGQEAKAFEEGATTDALDEKAHFEAEDQPILEPASVEPNTVEAPSKAAGYAPIEPRPGKPQE